VLQKAQLQRPNFKGTTSRYDFKGQRDKDLKKIKRDKHFVYPAFVLRKIVPGEMSLHLGQ